MAFAHRVPVLGCLSLFFGAPPAPLSPLTIFCATVASRSLLPPPRVSVASRSLSRLSQCFARRVSFASAPLGRCCSVAAAVSFPPPLRHRRHVSCAPAPQPPFLLLLFSAAAALLLPPSRPPPPSRVVVVAVVVVVVVDVAAAAVDDGWALWSATPCGTIPSVSYGNSIFVSTCI